MTEFDAYPIEEQQSAGEKIVAAGGTMMQTRSAFNTAVSVQEPRSLGKVERRLLDEAKIAGEEFYYGWGAGGNRIEGPSKELAFAAARCYGNCAVDALPVQNLGDAWVFTAAFIDLETGFTMTRQFRQSKKWQVKGKMDNERKDDIRFQIGQSKAARNAIINSLPSSLINRAMEAAKSGVKSRLEDYIKKNSMQSAVELVLRSLAKCGVKPEHICAKFEIQDVKALTVDHIVILRGDYGQIESGQERADALFPSMSPQQSDASEATDSKMDDLKKKLAASQATRPTQSATPQTQTNAAPPTEEKPPQGGAAKATKKQVADVLSWAATAGMSAKLNDIMKEEIGVAGVNDLTSEGAEDLITMFKAKVAKGI